MLIGAFIFGIIFYSWGTIKLIFDKSVTFIGQNAGMSRGFIWFACIAFINLLILGLLNWVYYNVKNNPGIQGEKGLPGQRGVPGDNKYIPTTN